MQYTHHLSIHPPLISCLSFPLTNSRYNRDWRYHKEERVWITRGPMMEPQVKTSLYERGLYYYFDHQRWCKVAKEFHLDYDKLEERPHLPASFHHNVSTNPVMAH